jgi:hypothetical protein
MKTYITTFGTGTESIKVTEDNCVSFSEAVIRMEHSGFNMEDITGVESFIF